MPVVPPTQQPLGHVLLSHAQVPSVVSQSPLAQAAHVAPPLPQAVADVPTWHLPAAVQHPLHVAALHVTCESPAQPA